MPVFHLSEEIIFPSPELAEPNGLLAVHGDLSPARLLTAYLDGIFPWYSEGEPILWWAPSPRLVLFPHEFHLPKRLARTMRKQTFTVKSDTAFREVITACGQIRRDAGQGTWITKEMLDAYCLLHDLGFAHSIETFQGEELAGGLYGVCIGKVFFGESMFTSITDASKTALASLVNFCKANGIRVIDCQMTTSHLLRFGARELEGRAFRALLRRYAKPVKPQKKWRL